MYPTMAAQIAALQKAMLRFNEELVVLKDCLSDSGVVRPMLFETRLHRHRFDNACKAHPWEGSWTMPALLQLEDLAAAVALTAGFAASRAVSSACSSTRDGIDRVQRRLMAGLPRTVYVCGGHDGEQPLCSAEAFNVENRTWKNLPDMRERRSGAALAFLAGRLYMCGGFNGSSVLNSVECFVPAVGDEGRWLLTSHMTTPRVDTSAMVCNSRLFVCGGLDSSGMPISSCEQLAHAIDGAVHHSILRLTHFTEIPPMQERRCKAASASVCNKLVVCGGRNDREQLSSVESFSVARNAWEMLPPLPEARSGATAAVARRCLYIVGGNSLSSGRESLSSVLRYEPCGGTWTSVMHLGIARSFVAAAGDIGSSGGSWFCVFGGCRTGVTLRTAEMFDLLAECWIPLPDMLCPRSNAAAATILG